QHRSWLHLHGVARRSRLPVGTQVLNGKGKCRIHIADKNERLILRPVGMKRVAVAISVRVIVANDGQPRSMMRISNCTVKRSTSLPRRRNEQRRRPSSGT